MEAGLEKLGSRLHFARGRSFNRDPRFALHAALLNPAVLIILPVASLSMLRPRRLEAGRAAEVELGREAHRACMNSRTPQIISRKNNHEPKQK